MSYSDKPVLILGAKSDMAREIANILAARGHPLMLAARNVESLAADVSDLEIRHKATVTSHDFDVLNIKQHETFLDALPYTPSIVVCAIGLLGDQEADADDPNAIDHIVQTNYLAPCILLEHLAKRMESTGNKSSIVGIGSVAGDRGRAKNYIYGSAKAGFASYLSGLRQKYSLTNLHIMTVKPGFVRTSMTEGMDLPGPLTSDAAPFASKVVKAMDSGKLVFYDLRWRVLMGVIIHVPESIFKKMKF